MNARPSPFDGPCKPTWCPGCGNFSILRSLKAALEKLSLAPHQLLACSGIGQAAKTVHYLRSNAFNGLHGRALPVATAAHAMADDLTVIVHSGDGDAYGEGCGHFVHSCRRNPNLTLIVHDNRIYGLTKGQASPTTPQGMVTRFDPGGVAAMALEPLALALSASCSFVAQSFSGRVELTSRLIEAAIRHRGFSLVNVLQPCVSFNAFHSFAWYERHVEELPTDHDVSDRRGAMARVLDEGGKLPLGILYQRERSTFEDRVLQGKKRPLRDLPLDPDRVLPLLNRFR